MEACIASGLSESALSGGDPWRVMLGARKHDNKSKEQPLQLMLSSVVDSGGRPTGPLFFGIPLPRDGSRPSEVCIRERSR